MMTQALIAGSLFSGGGLMDYALEQAGFTVAWQAENDRDASKVLGHHWPEVTNYDDVTQIDTNPLSPVEMVAGGSPCQSFSFSGHRAGLAGASGLFWEFLRIADSQPRAWVLWENVPGVLSIDHGETFALSSGDSAASILKSLQADGVIPDFVSVPNESSVGACWTLNTSASPSVAVESSLSDILWDGAIAPRYYLSPIACRGILRRAARQGKSLPPFLHRALAQRAREA